MTKIRELARLEIEEHEYAMELARRLDQILKFLVRHSADEDMIEAVCEVIEDNEQTINVNQQTKGTPDWLVKGTPFV